MTRDVGAPPIYTRRFWAKARPYRQPGPESIHLLEHHLADVGACFEALVAQSTIGQRLAQAGSLESLDASTAQRLALFAALHDIGKVNVGFQTKVWLPEDWPNGKRPPQTAGHFNELVPVIQREDRQTSDWFFDNLGWWWDAIETWDDRGGVTVCDLFVATLSHHGQPLQMEGNQKSRNPRLWQEYGNLDPPEHVRRIGQLARHWFPKAFDRGARRLPSSPRFQHQFLGLCTLADWIASNEEWFPYESEEVRDYMPLARRNANKALDQMGLNITLQRVQAANRAPPDFGTLFGMPSADPRPIQRAIEETPLDESLAIIESETGSGKTEAALLRFAQLYEAGMVDGLYFALPTRAAAIQLHGRVTRFVEQFFPADAKPESVLAVPGYIKADEIEGHHLQDYDVWWEDDPSHEIRARRWAAESSKRYLAAQIAVGTVDQAMMAALRVKHAHMRAACLSRNLLVVDEVHASDTYMRRILRELLDAHLSVGGHALLMSATLGSAARNEWLAAQSITATVSPTLHQAIDTKYPLISTASPVNKSSIDAEESGRQKSVSIEAEPLTDNHRTVAERALDAARRGAKVLVIRNTVSSAVSTQQALDGMATGGDHGLLFKVGGVSTLHHGRFAPDDRRELDQAVEHGIGKERPAGGLVIVGTQTLEQSLDIDADLLITDLCPVDVLLQRIGRLHRHSRDDRPEGYQTPRCLVLTPENSDLSHLLRRSGGNTTGLGPSGYIYPDLRVLEATRRLITEHAQWEIPQMNRELVERATHPDALESIIEEMSDTETGDAWREHANDIEGGYLADGMGAASAVILRDKSFFNDNRAILFGSSEELIRTRLGDEGIEVEFDPPTQSPFDQARKISSLTIPAHLLRGGYADDPVPPSPIDGGFSFMVGSREFRYDRLGLRRTE